MPFKSSQFRDVQEATLPSLAIEGFQTAVNAFGLAQAELSESATVQCDSDNCCIPYHLPATNATSKLWTRAPSYLIISSFLPLPGIGATGPQAARSVSDWPFVAGP